MARYRKKPVVIAAIQWNGWNLEAIQKLALKNGTRKVIQNDKELIIPTLEGDHIASMGDYIIQGIKGEIYPCKPDIFEQTYEKIN